MKRTIVCLLFILLSAFTFLGSCAVNDLKSDAKTHSLGFTFASDPEALFYLNPAVLSNYEYRNIAYTYSSIPFLDLNSKFLAARCGHFGLAVSTTNVLDVAQRGDYVDRNLTLSYGRKIKDELQFGLNLKHYNMKLEEFCSAAIGLDIALNYSVSKASFGLVVSNLAAGINNASGIDEAVPVGIRGGISYKLTENTKFNLDLDQSKMMYLGLEQKIVRGIKARLGSENGEFRVGLGMEGDKIQCDYAYSLNGLTNNQLLSLVVKF